ncbi:ArsR/SmtB family transcription factor [Pseudonocardia kunmingensis]|uniref:DNA-binding transcriptional ArsR family regulator n=1 Tax=Pseudonocardia kunmingensis TaxID=630975 RepID=A0A543DKQ5_9PSEU|nr:metalloregulator ArsR/SmtB family transcription factor [Pseudonocardia kunmingensis]TQM09908.1 DNA-binding transcriptional ArsR family regulator [Pseudonocardia kunmingensis]
MPSLPAPADDVAHTDPVTPERAATVFKALSDPLRIELVAMARSAPDGAVCFCDIAARIDMPQSSLSHHMRVLVDAGILHRERRGTWSWYRLRDEPFQILQDALRPGGVLLAPSSICSSGNADGMGDDESRHRHSA